MTTERPNAARLQDRAAGPIAARLLDLSDLVGRLVGGLSALLIVAIAAMILAEIVARSAFNISFSFAWEYSSYCMAAAIFCGAAFTLRTGGHVRVSLLSASVPARVSAAVDLLATLLGLAIAIYVAYALTQLAVQSYRGDSYSATITRTPLVVPQGAIAFGAVLFALQLLARLVRLLLGETPERGGGDVFSGDQ